MRKIALLGVGIMGSGMAENWLKKGFSLAVYNRTRAKAEALADKGARIANTPREAASGAELVLAMLADEPASRDVWLGDSGALAGADPGAVLVESSTVTPDWVHELSGHAAKHDCAFLDVPVGGSKAVAASGGLTLFVGGDVATLEHARPALEAIGRQIIHLGPTGAGATWKLINNMMLAVQVVAASEAMVLAEKAGFDPHQTASLIANGAAGSGMVQIKMPRFSERRFDAPDFVLRLMLKDSRYALALGEKYAMPLDMVRAAAEVYDRANRMGFGDLDFSGVLNAVAD